MLKSDLRSEFLSRIKKDWLTKINSCPNKKNIPYMTMKKLDLLQYYKVVGAIFMIKKSVYILFYHFDNLYFCFMVPCQLKFQSRPVKISCIHCMTTFRHNIKNILCIVWQNKFEIHKNFLWGHIKNMILLYFNFAFMKHFWGSG